MQERYQKEVLPSGLRIVTEAMDHVRSVAVGIWVETGSRVEPEDRGGISHLIEHLVFKGTATRSAEEIARAIDSVGGHMDAFTAKEHTCFYVSVLDEHLPLAVDLLTDVLMRPLFAPDDIEKEKSVVLQEIKMVEDTPDDLIHDLFAERVWRGHPLGRPILGQWDVVKGFGADTIRRHFEEEYAPARIAVAVAGHVEHARVVDLFSQRFEGFSRPGGPARDTSLPVPHPGIHTVRKKLEQVHLLMGFPGVSDVSPERYALYLLNDVVGGSMSSRLFQEIRERQALVYSVHSGTQAFRDIGEFYVYAGTDPSNFGKVIKALMKEIAALKKDGITADELRRAKDHLKGNLILSLESTSSRMNRLAKQELRFGSFQSVDDLLAAIDAVPLHDVEAMIHKVLDDEQLSLLTLGPVDRRSLPRELTATRAEARPPMIDRYTRPEMGRIWSQEAKYDAWLRVELAVCEVYARRGRIPGDAVARIKARAVVDPQRIDEIERTTRHDVIAFLTNLEESIGADSRFVHLGMTSSDVVDTALALSLQQACEILLGELERFRAALRGLALAHRDTLCVGRSHGVHAEPMTFGLKAALWYAEAGRNLERLRRARETVRVGKISGAVGTFAHIDPDVEEETCHLLGLEPAPVSSQIIQRDRHAELCTTFAIIAASLEKVAVEIRSLQRTEILEAEEPFAEGQKGSSAMPHKRNPIGAENVSGLARLVRSNAMAALENVALWHERDISHSSVERVILPDSTILLDYMLHRMTGIVEGLRVYPERMRENMDRSFGLMFSQRVLLALTESGLARQAAYEMVQRNAMRAWRERTAFRDLLAADPDVMARMTPAALDACFDPSWYVRNVDAVYRRVGLG